MPDILNTEDLPVLTPPQKENESFPSDDIKNDIDIFTHPDLEKKNSAFRWIDNPVYKPEELSGLRPDSRIVNSFMEVIHNHLFASRPPSNTGYIQKLKQERQIRGITGSFGHYMAQIDIFRRPLIEKPQAAQDYLYFILPRGPGGEVFTGAVEQNEEKLVTAFMRYPSTGHGPAYIGYAPEEVLSNIVASFTEKDSMLTGRQEDEKSLKELKSPNK